MPKPKFFKKEALAFGWRVTKVHLGLLVGIMLLWLFVPALPRAVASELRDAGDTFAVTAVFFWLLALVLSIITEIGMTRISLKLVDGQEVYVRDLFSYYRLFFNYLGAILLYGLIVLGGLVLLVVPGVMWAFKYSLVTYFVVDKGLGPVEALKQSGIATQGAKWNLFLLGLLVLFLNLAGLLALLVGFLVTVPITLIAYAYVYRTLTANIVQPTPSISSPPLVA